MNNLKRTIFVLLLLLLSGCATLQPAFETPSVSLTSFRLLPYEGMAPRFEIGLHVANPNLVPLPLKGISYKVNLEGHKLLNGVANNLPVIQGYGEGDLVLQATTDLFSGLRLLTELMAEPRELFTYEFEAKLDIGRMLPSIRIEETGKIPLRQPGAK
jgi:LEA14-like dessication related protein